MQAAQGLGLSPEQIAMAQSQGAEANINWGQAATAGAIGAAPGLIGGLATGIGGAIIGGAATGAAAGSVVPGAGTVALGILGAVAGLVVGIRNNIKSQQSGEIASTKKVLSAAKTNMRQLATLASKDPGNAAEYVELYNQQLANVYTAQAKLKRETSGNLNSFMNDGTQDLAEFDLFLQPGGLSTLYRQRLEMALIGGAPMEFTAEDLAMYEGEQ